MITILLTSCSSPHLQARDSCLRARPLTENRLMNYKLGRFLLLELDIHGSPKMAFPSDDERDMLSHTRSCRNTWTIVRKEKGEDIDRTEMRMTGVLIVMFYDVQRMYKLSLTTTALLLLLCSMESHT